MTLLCSLLLVSTTLSLTSSSPVRDNVGFMESGANVWGGRPWDMPEQERFRRQQRPGRPHRQMQPGPGRPRNQGRPNRKPRPQPQEKYFQAPQNRPLRPVKPGKKQAPPPPPQKSYKPQPPVEKIPPIPEVYKEQERVQMQEQKFEKPIYNEVEENYEVNEVERSNDAYKAEMSYDNQQPKFNNIDSSYDAKQPMYNEVERSYDNKQPIYNEVERSYDTNEPIYNEVERAYDTKPEPSNLYERSSNAPVEDSIVSESYAAPAEQRDLEAAVAAGAAAYPVENYADPKRLSFQIHGQGGPNAYKFGYDTGVGYNRQFRYEERDNYGVLHGRYGYYDQEGKLQVVNYTADPQTGFHAEGEHVPKPAYR